ncbi:hypothetical protein [Sulfoacidibacillus thermotolerans]|uniref:Uncharacterized protein n=1 Tax=Sulfoacidibacillus thermotolerans TaxID=1765684 RepID=A0A2U3D434_SULT2|nr:hypothetical protein [Sulfoacidibacillus thermotolerans]PWI56061.1 hypothetical protein BM613_13235 [Sulfoacidibacillus thermotolerans]
MIKFYFRNKKIILCLTEMNTEFDDLLRERGYGANVVRKALIEEGRIERGDKTTTRKYDAETKKVIRVIVYRNT